MRQLTRLIDNGVDPNVRDYDQRTAFHIAARRGSIKVVDYLVSCKAEINAVDRQVTHNKLPLRHAHMLNEPIHLHVLPDHCLMWHR